MQTHAQRWDFPVEMAELYAVNDSGTIDTHIPKDVARAVVRTDTGECLGIHKSRYHLRPYSATVGAFDDLITEMNRTNDLDLGGCETKISLVDNGARLRFDLDLPAYDFSVGHQGRALGDVVSFRATFLDSYDGQWATSLQFGARRLVCLNGMTRWAYHNAVRAKHTKNIDVDLSAGMETMLRSIRLFYNDAELFNEWQRTKISPSIASAFFEAQFAARWNEQAKRFFVNERELENHMTNYEEEAEVIGHNKWTLYNAMTRWATHGVGRKGTDQTKTTFNREIRVENIVNQSPLFKHVGDEGAFQALYRKKMEPEVA